MNPAPTLVVMTHNIWADNRWPDREAALRGLLQARRPDVYCAQELRPATRDVIDDVLDRHDRIHDEGRGWSHESNIWFDATRFKAVEHGSADVGIATDDIHRDRALFWTRLADADADGASVLIATAHFAFPGTAEELQEHRNPRIRQCEATAVALSDLAGPDEPLVFMGDLNESWHILRIMHARGFADSFTALGVTPSPTWPTVPTWNRPTAPWVIDFQFHRGPIRAMTTEVVDFFAGDIAPSDHKPVVTTYRIER